MSLDSGKWSFGMSGYHKGSAPAGRHHSLRGICCEPIVSLTEADAKVTLITLDDAFLASATRIATTSRYMYTATSRVDEATQRLPVGGIYVGL